MDEKKDKRVNQKTLLLDYLKEYGSIEPLTALKERLGARISDLKHDGHSIRTEMLSSVSKFTGNPVRYANYILMR